MTLSTRIYLGPNQSTAPSQNPAPMTSCSSSRTSLSGEPAAVIQGALHVAVARADEPADPLFAASTVNASAYTGRNGGEVVTSTWTSSSVRTLLAKPNDPPPAGSRRPVR